MVQEIMNMFNSKNFVIAISKEMKHPKQNNDCFIAYQMTILIRVRLIYIWSVLLMSNNIIRKSDKLGE